MINIRIWNNWKRRIGGGLNDGLLCLELNLIENGIIGSWKVKIRILRILEKMFWEIMN